MYRKLGIACAVLVTVAGASTAASAGVVFTDDFNSYAYQLNWTPPANWSAPAPGSVDLIGQTTTTTDFNFYPGNGGFVDLNGSTGVPGTLTTLANFAAGSYSLTFDLGGNARGDGSKTTVITLGSYSTSIVLGANDQLKPFTLNFTTNGGQLSFADLAGGNPNIGNILDNVTLASAVPEPATWGMLMMGFLGMGLLGYRRRAGNGFRLA